MQRIMLATDFSERSDRALRRAVILARRTGAHIDLVHVVDDDRPRRIVDHEAADSRGLLAELSRSLESVDGVPNTFRVVLADPFAGIAAAVAELTPDLLVIGPHRRHLLRDAFVGTTAERTIRAVACPVLMVNGPPVGPWRHVLLTTDLSSNSHDALRRFMGLGIGREGRMSIVSVFDAPALRMAMSETMPKDDQDAYLNDLRTEASRDLQVFLSGMEGLLADPMVRHEDTTVANVILRTAGELRADLVVVSTRGKGAVARMLLGSVAQQVLKDASIDVLAIAPAEPA
jgi:nucleotide-binding universal stress UspA family protein